MRFLDRLTGKPRNRIRERLCQDLRALGLEVRTAERDRPQEGIYGGLRGTSLGLIEIQGGGPIHWVNVLEHEGSRYSATSYTNVHVVPDGQIQSGGYVELKSTRARNSSVYGRVVDIHWTAAFVGTRSSEAGKPPRDQTKEEGLAHRLSEDQGLKENLMRLDDDIVIRSVPNYWCWTMMSGSYRAEPKSKSLAPTQELWDSYLTIAGHLLEYSEEVVGDGEEDPEPADNGQEEPEDQSKTETAPD